MLIGGKLVGADQRFDVLNPAMEQGGQAAPVPT